MGCVSATGVTDLEWREAVQRAGGPNNADKLWPVLLRGFDELVARKNAQARNRPACACTYCIPMSLKI